MVVKQDQSEIFAQIKELKYILFSSIGLFFLLISALISASVRTALMPLYELKKAIGELADGNLGIRLPDNREDEIGQVIRSFNDMTARLQHAQNALKIIGSSCKTLLTRIRILFLSKTAKAVLS